MTEVHSKYHARRVEQDGYTFDSGAEYRRYLELKLLIMADLIGRLVVHPRFDLVVNTIRIGRYTADFEYYDFEKKEFVVEDVKSNPTRTEAYKLRKKLVEALYGIKISEVTA
jgi:hypothetical protein